MYSTHAPHPVQPAASPRRTRRAHGLATLAAAALLLFGGHAGPADAAAPAGTSIGNQASATYTDGSGISRTVTSNTVQTVVQQVASLTLATSGAKTSSIGSHQYIESDELAIVF